MRGGGKALWATVALMAVAGCTADDGKLNIRPIMDPLSKASKGGGTMLDQARGLLALGSTGLALEAFRKALREQPDSVEALAGIAACYERMGRHDLARVNYEAALAIAPRNPVLLNTFAASLEGQGRKAEAQVLRAEAARADDADSAALVEAAAAQPVTVTEWKIEKPASRPSSSAVTVPLPAPRTAEPVPNGVRNAQVPEVPELEKLAKEQVRPTPAEPARNSTLPVFAARPVPTRVVSTSARVAPVTVVAPKRLQARLQRLSASEVALLTGSGPAWRTQVVAQSEQGITVRFVPLKAATVRPSIRLLNAARRQGLAARTREVLVDRGWRRIEIGDAAQVRTRSVVLYSPKRLWLARRLGSQFGFPIAPISRSDEVVVLLGRDAPAALRSRG